MVSAIYPTIGFVEMRVKPRRNHQLVWGWNEQWQQSEGRIKIALQLLNEQTGGDKEPISVFIP